MELSNKQFVYIIDFTNYQVTVTDSSLTSFLHLTQVSKGEVKPHDFNVLDAKVPSRERMVKTFAAT